jgi:hypothetical protein
LQQPSLCASKRVKQAATLPQLLQPSLRASKRVTQAATLLLHPHLLLLL